MNFNKLIGKTRNNFTNTSRNGVRDILNRANRATCGTFEREVVVKAENVSTVKGRLRRGGFVIVGTSEPHGSTRKIWFVPAGTAGI